MSGIVSNVGLFSGLPIQDIIDQLIAVEAKPLTIIQKRLELLSVQKDAYADLSSTLQSLRAAISEFDQTSFFRKSQASSSNEKIIKASAGAGAIPGSFSFRVRSLVSSHQLIGGGFINADRAAVGSGTLSIEIGHGKLSRTTFLEELNGQQGVQRGIIQIEDQGGHVARIDLTTALSIQDVVDAINRNTQIDVQASIQGDGIVLTDTSASPNSDGVLSVSDVDLGTMARDLGILKTVAYSSGRTLLGEDINNLSAYTSLNSLNDRNGVRRNLTGSDLIFLDGNSGAELFQVELNETMDLSTHLAILNDGQGVNLGQFEIKTKDNSTITINLDERINEGLPDERDIQTIEDVINKIDTASGGKVTARLSPGTNRLQLVDNTTGTGTFSATDLSGTSAADLGLNTPAATTDGVTTITAPEIFRITNVGDVVRAINYATGNYDLVSGTRQITAMISDNGLILTHSSGQTFEVQAGQNGNQVSQAAADLGILGASDASGQLTSRRLLAGIGSFLLRSLNGGKGVVSGNLEITNKAGVLMNVDLSDTENVSDVIEAINLAGAAAGIRAGLNTAGHGIAITDTSGGSGDLIVGDSGSGVAASLGFSGDTGSTDGTTLNGSNLQLQYISEATLVSDLNNGAGIGLGEFAITNRDGNIVRINISSNQKTVGDVLQLINSFGNSLGIYATINSTGDGIQILDRTGGSGTLKVQDNSGTVAKNLHLLGASQTIDDPDNPGTPIQAVNGSFELRLEIDADDTLNDVVSKINNAGYQISASVINDGSAVNPYRLVLTSEVTGTPGELLFDGGTSGMLSMSTLARPQDAVIFYGGDNAVNPIVLRSSTNSFSNISPGVTINLLSTSDELVEVTVAQDLDSVVEGMQGFIEAYNAVAAKIGDLSFFDSETLESGPLRTDPGISRIRSRLSSIINTVVPTDNDVIDRLASVGIRVGEDSQLVFDEGKFRDKLASDPQAVEELFTLFELEPVTTLDSEGNSVPVIDPVTGQPKTTFVGLGLGYKIDKILEDITSSADGLITRRNSVLQSQEDLLRRRAEDMLDLLDAKRARLEAQFASMERSLALLSEQQTALSQLSRLIPKSLTK